MSNVFALFMQVDPEVLDHEDVGIPVVAPEDQIRQEQDEIYSQLHRELEDTDRRVTRSRFRVPAARGGRAARRGRGRGRGRLIPRRGRGRRGGLSQESVPLYQSMGEDTLELLEEDTLLDTVPETQMGSDEEMEHMIIPPDVDYDSEGNPLLSSAEESSDDS